MLVEKNKVVSFHYVLRNDQGDELERSDPQSPALYLHGHDSMIKGLEKAMMDKAAGDCFEVTVTPEDGYGHRADNTKERVSAKSVKLPGQQPIRGRLEPGTLVEISGAQGVYPAVVIKMGLKTVDVDTNHPLAGMTLTFDVHVIDVRDATEEELSHGHAHGPGGHQH